MAAIVFPDGKTHHSREFGREQWEKSGGGVRVSWRLIRKLRDLLMFVAMFTSVVLTGGWKSARRKMELGGAPSGGNKEQANEEPKAPASDKQETSSQPEGGKEKEAPKEEKKPEPKKDEPKQPEPKKDDKPAPAPKQEKKPEPKKESKPQEESAYGSREERRVRHTLLPLKHQD